MDRYAWWYCATIPHILYVLSPLHHFIMSGDVIASYRIRAWIHKSFVTWLLFVLRCNASQVGSTFDIFNHVRKHIRSLANISFWSSSEHVNLQGQKIWKNTLTNVELASISNRYICLYNGTLEQNASSYIYIYIHIYLKGLIGKTNCICFAW